MESRKHDYKNRTLAAARLRKELEMLSDKVKKLMNFGPHFHICDVSEITEDHIHLESWNHDIKKEELPEDEEKMYLEEIQELITKYNKLVDDEIKVKEAELMQV